MLLLFRKVLYHKMEFLLICYRQFANLWAAFVLVKNSVHHFQQKICILAFPFICENFYAFYSPLVKKLAVKCACTTCGVVIFFTYMTYLAADTCFAVALCTYVIISRRVADCFCSSEYS